MIATADMDLNQIRADLRNCAKNNERPGTSLQALGFANIAMSSFEKLLLARRNMIDAREQNLVIQAGLEWKPNIQPVSIFISDARIDGDIIVR